MDVLLYDIPGVMQRQHNIGREVKAKAVTEPGGRLFTFKNNEGKEITLHTIDFRGYDVGVRELVDSGPSAS